MRARVHTHYTLQSNLKLLRKKERKKENISCYKYVFVVKNNQPAETQNKRIRVYQSAED